MTLPASASGKTDSQNLTFYCLKLLNYIYLGIGIIDVRILWVGDTRAYLRSEAYSFFELSARGNGDVSRNLEELFHTAA